ncbi:MAG: hypothetical protein AAGI90_06010 [Chlamydiota bacterium]
MLGHCSRIFAGQLSDLYANYFSPPESLSERARTSVNHLYQTLPSINDCRNLSLHLFAHYLSFSAAPATLAGMSAIVVLYDSHLHPGGEVNACDYSNLYLMTSTIIGVAAALLELSIHPIDRLDGKIDQKVGRYISTSNCKTALLAWLTLKGISALQYSPILHCSAAQTRKMYLQGVLCIGSSRMLWMILGYRSERIFESCFQEWKKQQGAYHSNIAWMREIGWIRDDA